MSSVVQSVSRIVSYGWRKMKSFFNKLVELLQGRKLTDPVHAVNRSTLEDSEKTGEVNNNHLDKPNLEPATDPVSSALSSPSLTKKKISPCRQFRTEHSSFTGHRYNSSMKKKIKPDLAFLDQIYEDEDDHGHDKLEDTISGVKILFSTTAVLV